MKQIIFIAINLSVLLSGCYHSDPMDRAYGAYVKNRNNCSTDSCRQVAAQQFVGQSINIANNREKWQPKN